MFIAPMKSLFGDGALVSSATLGCIESVATPGPVTELIAGPDRRSPWEGLS